MRGNVLDAYRMNRARGKNAQEAGTRMSNTISSSGFHGQKRDHDDLVGASI